MSAPPLVASRLLSLLTLALAFGIAAGHDWAGPARIVRALAGADDLRSRLLLDWRLPRVLAAALVGGLLRLGGASFHVFRNPLADPYLLSSAGGAAIGATVALLVALFPGASTPSKGTPRTRNLFASAAG